MKHAAKVTMLLVITLLLVMLLGPVEASTHRNPVVIQFLNVSDWHAQLDPLNNGTIGGAAVISAYWQQDRAANPNTIALTAGDAYGASPPLSGFFDEVPAVLAMNMMGFDVDTLGNHNFDRGTNHLQQMIDLAEFDYVSANLANVDDNLTGVAPYKMFEIAGYKVAVIGITNPEAPTLVFPGSFGTIKVTDPARAANRARLQARQEGARVVVAIVHMGVTHFDPVTNEPQGPLIDFANRVSGFDVIFGDHTDVEYNGIINGILVVENRSKGLTYARTHVTVSPIHGGRVVDRTVQFVTPLVSGVTPDPAIVAMLQPYRDALAEALDVPIGEATDTFPRGGNIERLQEVAIGNLISDSMRWRYETQLGFTNGGGIRAPLPANSYVPQDMTLRRPNPGFAPGPPWDLVIGDAYTILPFGNSIVTRQVSGAQLWAILEHSVAMIPGANGRFGQVSGFSFVYDSSQSPGSRVVSVTLDGGTPIPPDSTLYTFATNDFVNSGGDGYTMLADGQGVTREVMAEVLMLYIQDQTPLTPTIEGRIVNIAP
jgi:5'-nucleotidase